MSLPVARLLLDCPNGVGSMTDSLRPNLFAHATSELSQDAVLCWLLSWADHRCEGSDPGLHRLGRALVDTLLGLYGHPPLMEPYTVHARRQKERVDVVARIGDRYIIAIEDKTDTGPHSGQLRRYRKKVESWATAEGRVPVLVYVKTGERLDEAYVRGQGWQPYGRGQFLSLLRGPAAAEVDNDILGDFVRHLGGLERIATTWRWRPIAQKWTGRRPWEGLFSALEPRLEAVGDLGWGYVANPAGGFMALWWGHQPVDGGRLYVQLEQRRMAIKVHSFDRGRRRELRERWSRRVLAHEDQLALRLERPKRMGSGEYMTVAISADWRVPDGQGRLDFNGSLAHLRRALGLVRAVTSAP